MATRRTFVRRLFGALALTPIVPGALASEEPEADTALDTADGCSRCMDDRAVPAPFRRAKSTVASRAEGGYIPAATTHEVIETMVPCPACCSQDEVPAFVRGYETARRAGLDKHAAIRHGFLEAEMAMSLRLEARPFVGGFTHLPADIHPLNS